MKALIKEKDKNNKLVDFRIIDGTEDLDYFYNHDYNELQIVEQFYDGSWYIKGYVPTKSDEEKQREIRNIRNQYLIKYVDPYQLVIRWNTLTQDEQNNITNYRQYLLDYTNQPNWWEENPKTFEEWSK